MKTWAITHHLKPIHVKLHLLALYLQLLAEQSKSKAAVEEACNALSWIHPIAGLTPPLADPFVKATRESLQWSLAKSVVKKSQLQWRLWRQLSKMLKDLGPWQIYAWQLPAY